MKSMRVCQMVVLAIGIVWFGSVGGATAQEKKDAPKAAPAAAAAAAPAAAAPKLDLFDEKPESSKGTKEEVEQMIKSEMGDAAPGDNKEFTIRTQADLSTMEEGTLYKNEDTLFKVKKVMAKPNGAKGGSFIVTRIAGASNPQNRWALVAGKGPSAVSTTVTPLDLYKQGGFFMHPIFVLFIVMIVLVVNDALVYRRKVQCPAAFVSAAEAELLQGDLRKFEELSKDAKGLMPFICRQMVADAGTSSLADVRSRVESSTANYVNRMRIPIRAINLISVASPLMGLMGTIQGMIVVFEGIAGTSNAGRAAVLAGGIRTALFTTIAGLTVAIPALFAYFTLNQKHAALEGECECIFERFMHLLAQARQPKGQGGDDSEEEAERKAARG